MSNSRHRKSAVLTMMVMGCTLISRILGFVRTAVIGALFGAGGVADVINLVFSIPNNLRKLLAEGALSTAFIPELSKQLVDDPSRKSAIQLVKSILGLQLIIILPILAVSTFYSAQAVKIFENFADPAKNELSAVLFRWTMPYLLFISINAIMMAVHNTHGRFFIPAVTPIVFSLCVIGSLVVGNAAWGAKAIAYGVLAGGLAQVLVQYPSYRKLRYRLIPSLNFSNDSFKGVMGKWAPMLLTSSLFAVNTQIAMLLASFLPDKSASAISYAIVFYQLPFGIFSASITTVLYPKMSRQAVYKETDSLKSSLGFGYRNLWALLIPSAMVMMVLGEPIIAVAFQRGAFSRPDTILTARVLFAYSIGMPFVGLFNLTQRAFYALGEVRKPFICALLTVAADIILSLVFIFSFGGDSESLAWANSLAFIFGAVLQYLLIRHAVGFSLIGTTGLTFLKTLAANAIGLLAIHGAFRIMGTQWWHGGSSWTALFTLITVFLTSALIILGMYILMRVEVVSILFKRKQ
ncbi:MAG: murein biosynthesis integral membrane protein MurJ [Spirochaeta sp. LUC14_002_19_P3]|nr:MAG: murein biosynthesis integral membrane protein MurJ [Spirochaeta sp. LUC14_002_19_P3]